MPLILKLHVKGCERLKTDFDMIHHDYSLKEDMIIYPISDVHLGSKEHLNKEWIKFCNNILSKDNVFVTLGGDLINNATRSSVSNVFEDTMRPSEQKKIMAEMLKPLAEAGRILCAVSGNHERRSGKDADDDPMYDIMCKLDLEDVYRENLAVVKLRFGRKDNNGKTNPTYCFAVTHGAGGGMYTGASVNRNERFGYGIDGIDAIIVGHSHKGAITKPIKLFVDKNNNKISFKQFVTVSTVPWLAYGGYALSKMLLPATFGDPQVIKLYRYQKKIELTW